MNDTLEITTLGGLEIRVGGEPVTGFYSRKVEALLVYLACTGRPQPRDILADLLWDEVTQSRALGNLRVVLHSVREKLGPYVDITRTTAGLNEHSVIRLDVADLQANLDAAQEGGALLNDAAAEQIADAVSLYHGDFLAGFYVRDCPRFEEWQLVEQERLRNLVVGALNGLVAYHLDERADDSALLHARRLLELDPLLEEVHRQVMVCLASSGQRSAALGQYEAARRVLQEDLGVEPEPETTALYESILAGEVIGSSQDPVEVDHNLPVQLTPFVGRKAELAELKRLLADSDVRLVTLVGAGGTGKTRLALEAAADVLSETHGDVFEHGLFFVPLAPLRSAAGIVPALAEVLGFTFHEGGGQTLDEEQLLNYLRRRRLLLLMDNFEHLLAPPSSPPAGGRVSAELVTELLTSAPGVKILATSRGRLNVHGEQLFPLAGMAFPSLTPDGGKLEEASHYSAVQLFLQGARRVRPDFELTAENAADVVRICSLLGGMPLGILLAAAWVEMLSPNEIADQITRSIDFLATDEGGAPERQRSVRATFDYSWQLLSARQREVMEALSVFRGTFTWQAAQAVTGASLPELRMQVSRSLVHAAPSASAAADTGGRYDLHELLRQYARAKLDATPELAAAAHDRHCGYFAAALERFSADIKGARQRVALAEMRADQEDLRAAWDWAVERRQVARLGQSVEGLCRYHERRGRWQEGEDASRAAAEALSANEKPVASDQMETAASIEHTRVLGKVLIWQGAFSYYLGRTEICGQLLRQGLDLLEEPAVADTETRADRAWALHILSAVARDSGDDAEAARLRKQSLALYRAAGDEWGTAIMLGGLGASAVGSGAYDEAKRFAEGSLALRRAIGDRWGTANALLVLGQIALNEAKFEEAERLLREGVAIHREIDHRGVESYAGLFGLSDVLVWRGRFADAHTVAQEYLTRIEDTGHVRSGAASWVRRLLGEAKLHLGHYADARAQFRIGLDHARLLDLRANGAWMLSSLGAVALALEAYTEAHGQLRESVAQSQGVGGAFADYVLTLAFSLTAYAARGLGEPVQARGHVCQALQRAIDTKNVLSLIQALPAAALLLADAGKSRRCKAERAVELYALASRYGIIANSQWFEGVAGKQITAVAATLPPDVITAARERGQALDLWETAEELLEELTSPD